MPRERGVQRNVKEVQNRQSHEKNPASALVRLQLLGPFQMHVGGQKVALTARKARALLAYLAVRIDEDVPRDTLAGLLWSETSSEQARASLRQSLSSVRKALGAAADASLFSSNEWVRLSSDEIDVDRHTIAVVPVDAATDECSAIVDQYRGAFLEGFSLNEPEFDFWLTAERSLVRTQFSALLTRLVDLCEGEKRTEDAIRYATKLLTLDPLQEHVHRRLMQLFAAQGRYDAALNQFEFCRRELAEQLDVTPEPVTLDLVKKIKARRRASVTTADQPAAMQPTRPRPETLETVIGVDFSIPDYPSIAIMPFVAKSDDPDQVFFAEGISEDITTTLSKIDRLLVIAHESTRAYKGEDADLTQVSKDQGVRYVLEGSVRQSAGRVRVSARLIDTHTAQSAWAERYDRDLHDVFAVQDEITREIVIAMDVQLREGEQHRIWSGGTGSVEAWSSLRLAIDAMLGGAKEAQTRARELVDRALDLDPNYANAWAMRARLHFNEADVGGGIEDHRKFDMAQSEAFRCANHALEIDKDCAEAYAALALIHLNAGQHDKAVEMTEKAIALAPNNAEILGGVASAVMRKSGYPERGAAYVKRAMRLCPVYRPGLLRALGNNLRLCGQLEEAAACYRASINREAGYLAAYVNLASVLGELGRNQEAQGVATDVLQLEPRFSIEGYTRGLSYRRQTDKERIADGLRAAGLPDIYTAPERQGQANKPSVAILPFVNLSGEPEQESFSDGISGDIITELSRFRTLFVVARHSSFAFKGENTDIKTIGEKLGVRYIVEGSVRRAGSKVRITVQLIEVSTEVSLWAERYDRELDDLFAVQDEVTRSIVAVLPGRVQDSVAERAARTPTVNMMAYEYMLQGKHLRDGLNAEDTAKARILLEKALDLDPSNARAYMYLADTYVIDLWLGLAQNGAAQKSLDLSRKGAGLDNRDVYIQDQLGFAFLCAGLWEDAEIQFSQTLSRIVNEAESMAWCGYAFLLLGDPQRAMDVVVKAMQLDPLHAPALDWILGQIHFFSHNYSETVRVLLGEALLNSLAHAFLASAYAHMGKMDEARNALDMFIRTRRKEFSSRNLVVEGDTVDSLAGAYKAMWRGRAEWDLLADGLRKAGLPD